ncbi:hypothetical protein A7E78_03225 [Syntrophotalea acetylenivorans]|uniref:N-acetyltransferase domain-containing protein n=1 Tax=Syntrophotalea acetylenivorans TaxID=1842532 RepID=A0A1L3GM24_9BACT|nr:GNAT family N-acetyltransferase [Syntrophotalea acetylenivorans]APG26931.1 hypothetical protein A7E78_03225 [Syntrophotalea acetylenivorans]
MLSLLRVKYFQFIEHWHQEGFLSACCFALYHRDEEVPVVRSLTDLPPLKGAEEGMHLVEVTPENFSPQAFKYPLRSRQERVDLYFQKGYRGLAMVHDGRAIGDLWYVSRGTAKTPEIHPDVQRFKIDLADKEIYMFDMHVGAEQRGGGHATFLLNSVLHHLYGKGYHRAYGYYSATNIPALWVHRLLGYQELPHYIMRRFLLYRTAQVKD